MSKMEDNTNTQPEGNRSTENQNSDASPSRIETILLRLGVIGELMTLFIRGDRWWMAPLVLLLAVLGLALVVLQSIEYVAPFIYMAF
jgi:hypothetical protein